MKRSTLLILNAIAVLSYLFVGWAAGSIAHVDASVFSSQDSREYREYADWIFGARPSSVASNWRPFLYPLLLGLAERVGGVRGVWLLNVAVWFTALNFCAAATYRFVKSEWAAALVFLVLATNLSVMMLTYQGLTEPTVIALLAIWVYGLSRLTPRPTPGQIAWVLLPVTLAVVVKPEFEFLLAVLAMIVVVGIIRSGARGLATVVFAACLDAEPQWGSMPNRIWDTTTWVADSKKIRRELGWEPRHLLEAGFSATIDWFRARPSLLAHYEGAEPGPIEAPTTNSRGGPGA